MHNADSKNAQNGTEILLKEAFRKMIHLCAAFIPFFARLHFYAVIIALGAVTVLYVIFEIMRLKGKNVFIVSKITSLAARRRDDGKFVLGPVTLSIGILAVLLLFEQRAAAIGIFALAFGDGLSGLVGRCFGKKHLFNLKDKTLAGSAACFAAIFIACRLFSGNAFKSLIIAVIGTLAELLPLKDFDNIVIPIICAFCAAVIGA